MKVAALTLLLILCTTALAAAPPKKRSTFRPAERRVAKPASPAPKPVGPEYTLEEAEQVIEMLDDAYQTLLHEVHRHYPTKPGRPVAATVVRDVQKKMTEAGWPASRFLGVNAILMNPDHAARDAFDKDAAAALRRYEKQYEERQGNVLRKATMVSLGAECTSCHWPAMNEASRAGITWSVRLKPEEK